jgi:aryl-alcohol dehydrogenase-like predicted oxidoreductase
MGWDNYQKLLLILQSIANKHNVSIANVAVRYILDRAGVGAVIIGTRSSRHVASNEKIFSFLLDNEDIKTIESFLSKTNILDGDCYQLERESPKFKSIIKTNLNAKV